MPKAKEWSVIDKRKDSEIMNCKHLGMNNRNGNEDLESEKVKSWAQVMEKYQLVEENGKTRLTVIMDLINEHKNHFPQIWPKALEKLKEIAEKVSESQDSIRITAKINAPVDKVWEVWNPPGHFENWHTAPSDWHSKNDLRKGGKISSRMEAKDIRQF